jgi:hypothetical protein
VIFGQRTQLLDRLGRGYCHRHNRVRHQHSHRRAGKTVAMLNELIMRPQTPRGAAETAPRFAVNFECYAIL